MDEPAPRTPLAGSRVASDHPEDRSWPSTAWPAGPIGPPDLAHHSPPRAETDEPPAPVRSDRWTMVLTLLGGVLLGTGVTMTVLGFLGLLDAEPEPLDSAPVTTIAAAPTTTSPPPLVAAPDAAPSVTSVASSAVPSIVAVEVSGPAGVGGGSGVVYTPDGYIITNNHVIEGADDVSVVFSDGIRYDAEVIGGDPRTDIAIISTDRPDLAPIRLGNQADLVIGERTVAVGNPLGLQGGPSVTTGILSATGRTLVVRAGSVLYGLLQTDAPITRGSSGGALLDQEAKLIGITTAIGVSDVGAEGLGFAVPVDLVVDIADDLIETGEVAHALLGIEGQSVTETVDGAEIPLGVGVTALSGDQSAFSQAGGEVGDVVVQLEGADVRSIDALITMLLRHRSGDVVTVDVVRGQEELTYEVTLGEYTIPQPTPTVPESGDG